jgi:hypothetical protein
MKKQHIRLVFSLFIIALITISCETEENLQPEGNWTLSNPELIAPTSSSSIILDETTPNETITFSWEPAVSSAGYAVTYEVLVDLPGTDFSDPLISLQASNSGAETSLSLTFETIDQVLAFSAIEANTETPVAFAVRALSLSKSSLATTTLNITRFENETLPTRLFLSGTATESNDNLADAISMKRLRDANGVSTNVYEVYTSLVAGETYKFYSERSVPALEYGGADGDLDLFGDSIVAANDGQYRIKVDLDTQTYELLEINYWGMVGTPVPGGWNGDVPLAYEGNSIWKASIDLQSTGGFAFRANGDWGILLKRIVGTTNTVILESDANEQGVLFEDLVNDQTGAYFVTLNLSSESYSYSFEADNTVIQPISTPSQLFLLENGSMIEEFTRAGDVFSTDRYIPMQSSNTYSLNSAMDGSGTSYSVNGVMGETVTPDGDRVSGVQTLLENGNDFSISTDRALNLSMDFSQPELSWTYYNFKLFHWDVWDTRSEILMNYSHPNTYSITANLTAGHNSKFISPWDFDLGSDNPSATNATLSNGSGSDINNITTDGTYDVTIVLSDDYQSGTYQFD